MTNNTTTSSSDGFTPFSIDPSHPFYIHPSNNPNTPLVSPSFDRNDFVAWRRNMPALSQKQARHNHWEESPTTRKFPMGTDFNERFGQSNGFKYIQIHREISSTTQGSSNIATYFTKLWSLWDELYTSYVGPNFTCGALSKLLEEQQLFQFLSGLNKCYSSCKTNILMMSPLPCKAYSKLQYDEHQKEHSPHIPSFSNDFASFLSSTSFSNSYRKNIHAGSNLRIPFDSRRRHTDYNQRIQFESRKGNYAVNTIDRCKYYKRPGHVINDCHRIHGFPADFKFTKNKKASTSCVQNAKSASESGSLSSIPAGFNNDQYQHY
ncbi:uncharacterized protein LOC124898127 [Capsicum annuum]|uniref:uncharacterized protein LOC124898127 n=1 Tax=Capsicum annuum TaxID=4072 RepID=UPI001FB1822F|nr:uncharacterized protein LOC124898127 [Capsicum annuum]